MKNILVFLITLILSNPAFSQEQSPLRLAQVGNLGFSGGGGGGGGGGSLSIPAVNNATINWQLAGMAAAGGIPTGRTQCGSTITPTGITPPQSSPPDDATTINAAIVACTAGQKVVLSGATFHLDQSEIITIQKGITLTGSGTCNNGSTPYCQTVLNVDNGLLPWSGAQCGLNLSATVACVNGPGTIVFWSPGVANQFDFGLGGSLGHCGLLNSAIGCGTQLDADAAQGATTIQVHTTTGISVGQVLMLDEATGAKYQTDPVGPNLYGTVWAAPDWLGAPSAAATGRAQWAKFTNCTGSNPFCDTSGFPYLAPGTIQSQYDRPTTEMHIVTAVANNSSCPGSGCTVTFDSPLMIAFRVSGMATFTGAIAATALTTTGDACDLAVGQIVDDATHTTKDGTYVTAIGSCSAGVGSYTVNQSQTVSARTMTPGAHQAHVYWATNSSGTPVSFLQNAGIENLTVNRSQAGGINYQFCANCWNKGVEVVNWGGGFGASGGAVNLYYSMRVETRFTFMNNCGASGNNGAEYPYGQQDMSSENLLIDSIAVMCGKGMVGKSGGGNVVAYNYVDKQMYDAYSGIGDWFDDNGVNSAHWVGTHHALHEGNFSPNLDGDDIHGNSVYMTFVRNWGTALRSDFMDPSCPIQCTTAVSDKTPFSGSTFTTQGGKGWSCPSGTASCVANGTGFLRAAGPQIHMYLYSFAGNVLGTATVTTAAKGWNLNGTEGTNVAIWASGWNSDAANVSVTDPYLNGTNNPQLLFKNCNYDYVTASVADCAGGIYTATIPNSFFLPGAGASAPSWWPSGSTTYPFPWVTANLSTKIQTNSLGGPGLPAKARYDAGTPFQQP